MLLVNGHSEHCLDVSDRAFQYGDGLFETIRIKDGKLHYFARHFQRLQQGCERLLLPCPAYALLHAEALSLAQDAENAVLKIIISRGSGGRGYRQPEVIKPTRVLALYPYPDYAPDFKQRGVVARFCQLPLSINPALAGMKHLNRLEQVLARAEWQDSAIQEGIMSDTQGRVIEGTMSNLFLVQAGGLCTAPLTDSGVAGIMRSVVVELARLVDIPVSECYFNRAALMQADEIFFTNAVIGIWPVRQLEQQAFAPGAVTARLMTMLDSVDAI